MCSAILHLLILLMLVCQVSPENDRNFTASCPGNQKAFRGSCFELVALQRSFHSAQDWCEDSGGHLAFISDKDTQIFLERLVDSEKDSWIGLAPSCSSNEQLPLDAEGPLAWLDGSPVTFSKWASIPQPGTGCGHVLRNSDFQWEATRDCYQEKPFICQFESGRRIIRSGRSTSLKCSSDQVLMIDGGRRSVNHCPSRSSPPTFTHQECAWVDAVDHIKAGCQGQQVCQIDVMNTSDDLCPDLRSYLTVEFHCKDARLLSTKYMAAVSELATITIELHHSSTCKLNTGDGKTYLLSIPKGTERSVVHTYTHPGPFVVVAKCTNGEKHATTQKIIAIQTPVTQIGVIRCFAGNMSFPYTNYRALNGKAFQIQMKAKAGTNVIYTSQAEERLLGGLSMLRANVPQNITVNPESVKQLGPGCYLLTLYASNGVAFPEGSTNLQVCILEKISGLQASMLRKRGVCSGPPCFNIYVSLNRGELVLLLFSMTGDRHSFSEIREMNSKRASFHIKLPLEGSMQVKIKAWNAFSSQEVHVFASRDEDSVIKLNGVNENLPKTRKRHVRVVRSPWSIKAVPSNSVNSKNTPIRLSVDGQLAGSVTYDWRVDRGNSGNSGNKGNCNGRSSYPERVIDASCLPDPFHFDLYSLTLNGKGQNSETNTICVTVNPDLDTSNTVSLSCSGGCNQGNKKQDATITLKCNSGSCTDITWYMEVLSGENQWDPATKDCYKNAQKVPLTNSENGQNNYKVDKKYISDAMSQNINVTVVVTYARSNQLLYQTYVIKTSSRPATTTKRPLTSTTRTTSKPTTQSSNGLSCVISPLTGTIVVPFQINCTTKRSCPDCQYCFKAGDKNLLCSKTNVVKAVFLPRGDNLLITATANAGKYSASTTLTVQVSSSSSLTGGLSSEVSSVVAQLKDDGLLSGATVGGLINSVATTINNQSDASSQQDRQKLREQMLDIMIDTVNKVSTSTPQETQVLARGLTALTEKGNELRESDQVSASKLFSNLSLSIVHMNVNSSDEEEVITAAIMIIEGLSNILKYSSDQNTSDTVLEALYNLQSALLKMKTVNEGPTIIAQPHIGLYVNRVTPGNLSSQPIGFANTSYPTFSLPELPVDMFPSEEPVDVRMLSLDKNPFSWNLRGNISGLIGGLSLTAIDGSGIPVENLSEDVEILLPRPAGEQVNTSVLDLRNYSTTAIDVPSADSTLLLKMVPSMDPLPFKLLLGYRNYPTDSNYIAMTQMPLQGSTQEERYTWILDGASLKGNTGTYYLVVRPIVGPGIKSINATLSITPITSSCKFWNETQLDWKDSGCKVGVKTTPFVTQCLCNHLTFFGSSFFVTPNLVDPSQTAQLFATFAQNPVVVCFVGALFVTYLLVVVWARRKDIQDTGKVKGTVLADNDPMDNYFYLLSVCTGRRMGASTSSQVVVTLLGAEGSSQPHHLSDPKKPLFERGAVDLFLLASPHCLGELQGIRLWHNNSGSHSAWFVGNIMVQDLQTDEKWFFLCNSWLAVDKGECSLNQIFHASTETDLKTFSNLFFMKTAKDFSDGHLWFSVMFRPPNSTFTCVQRVSCCFSLLLCTMLTSLMFYGIPTDPSEQVMDLGHFQFTWQQFMVGLESSLIMFPINLIIVGIFRNTRPRQMPCCQSKTKKTKTLQREGALLTVSSLKASKTARNAELDNILKDITRIVQSFSETTKSNIPCTKFGKESEINVLLSEVERFIQQNDRIRANTQSNAQSKLPVRGIEKQINKTQQLYKQLGCLEGEMNQLDTSSFSNPDGFRQTLQQVQNMKSILRDHLFTSSPINQEEHQKSIPADFNSDHLEQNKKVSHQGCLPWWFIFVGWLLVIGTSVIAGYFTMLYGLKFGKERSISWLVSMVISFFHSLLLIQPIKVICLAVFFALVIKKVEGEDFQNVVFEKSDKNPGDENNQHTRRWDDSLYEPPSPADIERMKRKKILEQKAFALLTEILTYLGFMWMLLLVAFGQKDPNAFFLNQHIINSFTQNVQDSMSTQDVFMWANTSLLPNLFGEFQGFITDGNSRLVGNARLRQLRVQKNSCQIAGSMLTFVSDCNAPYSWEMEDMGSYEPGWNHSLLDNISTNTSTPWKYQTQSELRNRPFWGRLETYRGGGYVADLGPNLLQARGTLDYLWNNKWLDEYTRAVFAEFTVYNANVNLFCIVTFLMETAAVGAFRLYSELQIVRFYQAMDGLYFSVMVAEILYLLFILYYMFQQGKLMKQQRWTYFKNKWNLLELSIILLSWSAVALFIKRTILGNRDLAYYQNHKDQFASFYDTATADIMLQYVIAFLVLLSNIKLWHLLRLNPKMNLITAALRRASTQIFLNLVVIAIILVAYAVTSNIIYGWELASYKTFTSALLTLICLQIGIFNFDEVLNDDHLIGGLLFGSCTILLTFVALNLFVAVILASLEEEQKQHKPSEEEEVVDLLLNNICSLFGIRYKNEKKLMGLDVNGSGGLAVNNSRDFLNTSSADVNIYQKTGH